MRSRLTSMLVVSALAVAAAATPAGCAESNGLEFAMTTDKITYRIGEPIRVSATWTNKGSDYLQIPNWRGPLDAPAELTEGNHTVYEFAVYFEGKERIESNEGHSCRTQVGSRLEPRQSLTRSYDIGEVYRLVRPGRFALRAVLFGYPSDDNAVSAWRGRIVHPDVEIRILE
jgi:hypothetical protein